MSNHRAIGIVLDSHDPELAGHELYDQLTKIVVRDIEKRLEAGEEVYTPEGFADALANATSQAIVTAFHIGRAWQDAFNEHQREHELEHGGSANN